MPRRGDRPIYIIDRQPFNWSLTTWLGAYDLAYALVLDWPTELRRQCELPILARYHARLSVAMCVYVAMEYCRGGINERWIHTTLAMLQRSLTACDDLGCRALWKEGP